LLKLRAFNPHQPNKNAAKASAASSNSGDVDCPLRAKFRKSALARLEARVDFVDDIKPATATNNAVCAVTLGKRFQGITDFHLTGLS
jgi:hypothetical protein